MRCQPMKREKIFIYSADPCWKRLLDANKIKDYLLKNDYNIVCKPDDADTIIIMTCAFIAYTTEFALKKITDFKQYDAEIIVAGCLPDINKEKLSKIFNGETLKTKELDEKIEVLFPPKKNVRFKDMDDANFLYENPKKVVYFNQLKKILYKIKFLKKIRKETSEFEFKHLVMDNRVRYFLSEKQFHIRVGEGCMGNCSYCGIKKAIGKCRSKPLQECIKEFELGLSKGYKNFFLDASDVGLYGIDINSSFPELLDEFTKKKGDYKITLREVHPNWVVKYIDDLEKILKRNKILIFDLSLQSINKRILQLMKRYSDVDKIKNAIKRLMSATDDVFFSGQFIICFPNEKYEEFQETLDFIIDMKFNGGQLYLYSCKENTEAEKIEPKIPEKEMMKRLGYSKKFLRKNRYYVKYIYSNENKPFSLDFINKDKIKN